MNLTFISLVYNKKNHCEIQCKINKKLFPQSKQIVISTNTNIDVPVDIFAKIPNSGYHWGFCDSYELAVEMAKKHQVVKDTDWFILLVGDIWIMKPESFLNPILAATKLNKKIIFSDAGWMASICNEFAQNGIYLTEEQAKANNTVKAANIVYPDFFMFHRDVLDKMNPLIREPNDPAISQETQAYHKQYGFWSEHCFWETWQRDGLTDPTIWHVLQRSYRPGIAEDHSLDPVMGYIQDGDPKILEQFGLVL